VSICWPPDAFSDLGGTRDLSDVCFRFAARMDGRAEQKQTGCEHRSKPHRTQGTGETAAAEKPDYVFLLCVVAAV
jgi:hypothetical protein